ncbi:MAG: helix-turn-helix domain-containing protein [Lachnospiraceae bacterium]|nr:helix-turn-helix domain-containing protein [Lachnospiraceae bacterium]
MTVEIDDTSKLMYSKDAMCIYDYTTSSRKTGAGESKEASTSCRLDLIEWVRMMAFVKADLKREKEELNKLVAESEEARKAHEEFQAMIALQQKLIETRKAEKMTQSDVANATGLSQQAVSRIEKGAGATVGSLIKYLMGIGYCIELKKI